MAGVALYLRHEVSGLVPGFSFILTWHVELGRLRTTHMKPEGDEDLWRHLRIQISRMVLHRTVTSPPTKISPTQGATPESVLVLALLDADTLQSLTVDMEAAMDLLKAISVERVPTEGVATEGFQAVVLIILTTVGGTTAATSLLVYFPALVTKVGSTHPQQRVTSKCQVMRGPSHIIRN